MSLNRFVRCVVLPLVITVHLVGGVILLQLPFRSTPSLVIVGVCWGLLLLWVSMSVRDHRDRARRVK